MHGKTKQGEDRRHRSPASRPYGATGLTEDHRSFQRAFAAAAAGGWVSCSFCAAASCSGARFVRIDRLEGRARRPPSGMGRLSRRAIQLGRSSWTLGLAFFYFYIFQNCFLKEIYFRFYNLHIYTPTTRLRGGRPPAALLPDDRILM